VPGTAPSPALAVGLAIALVAVVGTSLSLTIPLLALELERRGVAGGVNGLNAAIAGLANIVIAPFLPGLAARFGLRRLLTLAIGLGAATTLAFLVTPVWLWFPLRFGYGAAIGTLFVLSEFWISTAAPPARRGLVMGLYATVLSLGFATGPAFLGLVGTHGPLPYVGAALLFAAALVPLSIAGTDVPGFAPGIGKRPRLASIVRGSPTPMLAALAFGAIETAATGLLPIFGIRIGLADAAATTLVSAMALGSVALQIPIGWLADRLNRRVVLFACAALATLCAALLPLIESQPWLLRIDLFLFGGIAGGLYTVGLAMLGQRFQGPELAAANAACIMLYSFGMLAGPPLAGAAMDVLGPAGLAVALTGMPGAYGLFIVLRALTLRRS